MDSHTRFVVTAWRNRQELLQLRHDLYSAETSRRERAVNKVFAWRLRKPDGLPLLLDSTADIVDVVLQDEGGELKHNALRLLYATAISRFVTGLADTQIDLTRDKPSWFPPGKILQLPSALLETRHRIVHRHLPSLAELKQAAKASLDWLWEWYWIQLDHAFSAATEDEQVESNEVVREKTNTILKTYVKERKNEIKMRKNNPLAAEVALGMYNLRFASSHSASTPSIQSQRLLLQMLVGEKTLLPTDKKLGSNMSGAFLIWTPILLAFCTASPLILAVSTLLTHIMQAVNAPSQATVNVELDPTREGWHDWLIHILTSTDWALARGQQAHKILEDTLVCCFSEPTYWNLRLAATLLGQDDVPNRGQWRAVLEAARRDGLVEMEGEAKTTGGEDGGVHVVAGEHALQVVGTEQKGKEDEAAPKEKIRGPQKVLGMWKPRPIGWLPEGWEDDEWRDTRLDSEL